MLANRLTRHNMSFAALRRTQAITSHFMSTSAPSKPTPDSNEPPVLFESHGNLRQYILNRPAKLNTLNQPMLDALQTRVLEWAQSDLCHIVVGTGVGRAFCAGGDVASVVQLAKDDATRPKALKFFKDEFQLDLALANLGKPYIAFMDGFTMGGGVGLVANATFRIATEKTVWCMPETDIGYTPDVGASHFLHNLDGNIGMYLGLTGDKVYGSAVYELGLATHYIPSRRLPDLISRLAAMENASYDAINATLDEHASEIGPDDVHTKLVGPVRAALDSAFSRGSVKEIISELESLSQSEYAEVRQWSSETLSALQKLSPTSLKVAHSLIKAGKPETGSQLQDAYNRELHAATAFCSGASPDFIAGVTAKLLTKPKANPTWSPAKLEDVTEDLVARFHQSKQAVGASKVQLHPALRNNETPNPMTYALPTERLIQQLVEGSHISSASTAITLPELLSRLQAMKHHKSGIQEKVMDVVHRRIKQDSDGFLTWR